MKEEYWSRWIVQTARTWNDVAEVVKLTGIEKIDKDHKVLIESALELNRLIEAFQKEAAFLERVSRIWQKHVDREEEMIRKFSLPNLGRQKDQHRKFLDLLNGFINDFKSGRLWVSVNLKMSVLEWVVEHINTLDHDTFCAENWIPNVVDRAESWDDVADLVKSTTLFHLDDQHKDLIDLTLTINPFIADWESGNKEAFGSGAGADLVARIRQYEEEFIANNGIPGLEKQREEHGKFIAFLTDFERRCKNGEEVAPREVKNEVMLWWIDHINHVDMETFDLENWIGVFYSGTESWSDLSQVVRTTGIDRLDEEHKDLIMLTLEFNEVIDQVEKGEVTQELRDAGVHILDHLYQFSKNHFDGEVAFIKKHSIPGLEKQEGAHQHFLDMLLTLSDDIQNKRIIFSPRIKSKIIAWWNDHINHTDYNTFKLENWAAGLFEKATDYEEVAPIIKKTGVERFDADHKDLVVLTLEICKLSQKGAAEASNDVARTLARVYEFTAEHFQREETFMNAQRINGREAHQDKHRLFLRELDGYRSKPQTLLEDRGREFKLWMFDWWINHINEVDHHTFMSDVE